MPFTFTTVLPEQRALHDALAGEQRRLDMLRQRGEVQRQYLDDLRQHERLLEMQSARETTSRLQAATGGTHDALRDPPGLPGAEMLEPNLAAAGEQPGSRLALSDGHAAAVQRLVETLGELASLQREALAREKQPADPTSRADHRDATFLPDPEPETSNRLRQEAARFDARSSQPAGDEGADSWRVPGAPERGSAAERTLSVKLEGVEITNRLDVEVTGEKLVEAIERDIVPRLEELTNAALARLLERLDANEHYHRALGAALFPR
jgi:hypothetical protein